MAIPQHTIDQILDRIDLVELIGSRVKLKKAGKTYSACCPFHQEKSPSFTVDRNKGFYHCFGCHAHGNAIGFLMQYENRNFIDVIKDLAQQAGIELPKDRQEDQNKFNYKRVEKPKKPVANLAPTQVQQPVMQTQHAPQSIDSAFEQASVDQANIDKGNDKGNDQGSDQHAYWNGNEADWANADFAAQQAFPSDHAPVGNQPVEDGNLYDLLEKVAQFYEQQLTQHSAAQAYLKQRGLDDNTVQFWRLGYAPSDWQHLQQYFAQDIEGLKAVGLIRENDKGRTFDLLRDRVIFPIRDPKGRVVGFGGRAMNDEVKPKYINSPESVIFHKGEILYGLFEGRKVRAAQWLMVEGYMDVIALQQAGLSGAVASLGTATNVEHLNTLFKQNHKITLAFDGDTAGQRAAWRTLELALPVLSDGRALHFLILPEQHDPDSLVRVEGLVGLNRRIKQAPPLSDFLFSNLAQQININSPEGKSQLMSEVNQYTQLLPKYGVFKRLLEQTIKEKLGLAWNKKNVSVAQSNLSFESNCSLEDKAFLLLLQYPSLYYLMSPLLKYELDTSNLSITLNFLKESYKWLPEGENALFFIIAALSDQISVQKTCLLLDTVDISTLTIHPEKLEQTTLDLVAQFEEKQLNQKIRTSKSLADVVKLKRNLISASQSKKPT